MANDAWMAEHAQKKTEKKQTTISYNVVRLFTISSQDVTLTPIGSRCLSREIAAIRRSNTQLPYSEWLESFLYRLTDWLTLRNERTTERRRKRGQQEDREQIDSRRSARHENNRNEVFTASRSCADNLRKWSLVTVASRQRAFSWIVSSWYGNTNRSEWTNCRWVTPTRVRSALAVLRQSRWYDCISIAAPHRTRL